MLPTSVGFYSLPTALGLDPALPRATVKLLQLAIHVPLFFLLAVWARLSAWQKYVEDHSYLSLHGEAVAPDLISEVQASGIRLAHGMGEASEEGMNPNVESISAEGRSWLRREEAEVRRQERLEGLALPKDLDYMSIRGLRIEAAQKLTAMRPASVGQASRISGVNPADISVLLIYLGK